MKSTALAKLPIGKARYGIMLRDDGMVMNDGTTWRFSDSIYLVISTGYPALFQPGYPSLK
jgi:glycine cleavage system aminomethyltransferase T